MRRRVSEREPSYARWAVVAGCLLVVGVTGSLLSAQAVAANRSDKAHQAFHTAASDVASRLKLKVEHEYDLVVTAAAALANDPSPRAPSFVPWVAAVNVLGRYPEVRWLGAVALVPSSAAGSFSCPAVTSEMQDTAADIPAGTDFCAGDLRTTLMSVRDLGRPSYAPLTLAGTTWLGLQAPYYRGRGAPLTVDARQERFAGWLEIKIDPQAVLTTAREGHAELGATLAYDGGGSRLRLSSGRSPEGGQVSVTDLGRGWSVRIVGAAAPGGLLSGGSPLFVFLGGIALSVLLALLLMVLASGRTRALRLVDRKTDELMHQAMHDALTGLPNRALVLDRVEQALARANRRSTPLAVMFLDLDGFKGVNDTYGHAAGDQLLRAVSARLSGVIREEDTVGRLGGDEFVVVAEGSSLALGPEVIAERIQAVLAEPISLAGTDIVLRTRASIGIAVGQRPCADDLLRDADVALYEAKAAGKDCYVVFAPEMQTAVVDRLELEMDLSRAVDTDQLCLVYQPTFDLRTEKITGVEALLRWNHPTRGLVMPDDFIPIAEECGQIVPIGRWVLLEACRRASVWERRGQPLSVAVNVSGRQLEANCDLVADVQDALSSSGLSAGLLMLEITETMLMRDATRSARQLRELKALGVRIAIDDFGTGYCSLAYLQQFPVDALKIDRSFINGIANSPESGALVHTLVQLGKALGIETYAEGIEERSQLLHMQNEQCDTGQGYLFARPLCPEALEELLGSASSVAQIPQQGRGTVALAP